MKAKRIIPSIFLSGFSFLCLFGTSDLPARSRDDRELRPDVGFKVGVEWGGEKGVQFNGSVHGIVQDEHGNYLKREIGWDSDQKATTTLSKGRSSFDDTIKWEKKEVIKLNDSQNTLADKKGGWANEKPLILQESKLENLSLDADDVLTSSKTWDGSFDDTALFSPVLLPAETILSQKFLSSYLVFDDFKFLNVWQTHN